MTLTLWVLMTSMTNSVLRALASALVDVLEMIAATTVQP